MSSALTKTGHVLAKGLGIKLDNQAQSKADAVTRGESIFSVQTTDTFVEEEPTTIGWIREIWPTGREWGQYVYSLFPFVHWIGRYNLQWLTGDLVAGITIGAVVVPQGMAYAILANLPAEYGLYSSFMGVLIYWFFATSKDITIGPVAVMSTIVGNIITRTTATNPEFAPALIASSLAIIAGAIVFFLGIIRVGWIVELIPLTAISAFMTGSALNIAVGQLPTLLGTLSVDTKLYSSRAETYLVFINTLKYLGRSNLNAAMGVTALAMLYIIRSACNYCSRRFPKKQKTFFFISTLRTVFVILLYTMISWLVNRNIDHSKSNTAKFLILGNVPRGFQHAGAPRITVPLIRSFVGDLPLTVIVLLIEHIAISKSFGRINNYTINPSQELVAIGITNLLGPFLGAYPATGSFSRTAIKSKAGVRTPFAGVITAIVVLLALYALPPVFFYIPNASLAAVIIHAVGDLITPPNTVYQFWRVSPLDVIIFFVGVFVTIFSSIENGIYCTISIAAAVLLYRVLRAKGDFLGVVKIHSVIGDQIIGKEIQAASITADDPSATGFRTRNVFLPIDHHDGSNPEIEVQAPYPGIFVYRFSEGFNYPNASHLLEQLVQHIFRETRRTNPFSFAKPGDRPWNDPGPRPGKELEIEPDKPTLKAIVLDFSSVNNIDVTSIQNLIDVRNQLDKYTAPETVDWHIACINNRWTKRALAAAGFGYPSDAPRSDGLPRRWKPIFSVADIGGADSAAKVAEAQENEKELRRQATRDAEHGEVRKLSSAAADTIESSSSSSRSEDLKNPHVRTSQRARTVVVHGINRPLFHIDLTGALQSAIANIETRENFVAKDPEGHVIGA